MSISRKTNQVYISRDIDFFIEKYIANQTGKVLFVHGQGGVGKSMLLKKFLAYEAEKIPTVLITIQKNNSQSFVNILLDEDMTSVKHCPNFEKIRAILLKEPKLLNAIINTDMDVVESKIGEYDQEWGEYAKIAIDGIKAGAKFLKSGEEKTKKEFLNNPEMVLLSALAEDFEEYGLFMVDTFEKIKNTNIKSKINFEDSGELSMRLREKNYRLKDYIEGLVYLLVENATFIIAGRNSEDELGMDIPTEYTEELSLEKFSKSNIKEFFTLYEKNHHLPMPNQKHLKQIEELTNGNPLLIGLFPKIAKEYDSWDEFDYAEMQKRMNTDPDFGLLFYMTKMILTHIEGIEDIWKLVIPRVLNREIEKLLFAETKVLDSFVDAGLGFKGLGKEFNRYYLHDDVHRAILNDAKLKYGDGLASWHDNEKIIKVHKALIKLYQYMDIDGVHKEFEIGYHTIMLKKNFEKNFDFTREEYIDSLLASMSISNDDKNQILKRQDNLNNHQQKELVRILKEEKVKWLNIFSPALYEELAYLSSNGKLPLSFKKNIDGSEKKDETLIVNWNEDVVFLLNLLQQKNLTNDSSLYYILGDVYFNKKEYDQAIASYQKAIAINPKDDKAYYGMGVTYANKKEYDQAIASYQKAIAINPKDDKAYYGMGVTYDNKKEYDQAIASYQKAIEINPKRDEAYYNMGVAYDNKKEYDQAIASYQKAIAINPKDDKAYYNMGVTYDNKKEYDQAIASYQKAIAINPEKDEAYYNMGNAYDNKKAYDQAIASYQKAIAINPKDDKAYYNMGNAYDNKKAYDQAIASYQKAIAINPKDDKAYYNMGVAYDNKKEYDQAIASYQKAIAINPKDDKAYYNMGVAYDNKKEYDQAIASYQKAIAINPKRDEAYYGMGIAYGNKKEYDQAIASYQKAIEINPKRDEAYYGMGIAYANKKAYDQAIASYQKAIAINPKKDEAYNNMGIAYANKKAYDQAIASYQKAIAINPKKDEAYYGMGIVYYHLGEFEKVIKSYTEALKINPNNSSAYTNLFELQLTQNQAFDQALESKYIELFQNQKESFIKYEMLKIFQALASGREVSLERWEQEYRDVSLGWGFDELREWIDGVGDDEVKTKLLEALGVFEGH